MRPRSTPGGTRRTSRALIPLLISAWLLGACGGSDSTASSSTTTAARGPLAAPAAAAGPFAAAPSAVPVRHLGPQGSFGQFVTDCALSHTAPEDPIVHPSTPAAHDEHDKHGATKHARAEHDTTEHGSTVSHLHNFFGNTSTGSGSTLDSLRAAGTTCQKKLDTAAYWSPALYDHGEFVPPTKSTAYYRVAPDVDPTKVTAFPPGLKIIAGDAAATSAQPADLVGWSCGTSTIQFAAPPDCPVSAPLRAAITFPDCWDGVNTDSTDHRSHMTNSSAGLCPESHPVHVPQLTFVIVYPIFGTGHELSLASGPVETLHADFINAWHQDSLEREIGQCLRRDITCSISSNRGEEYLFEGY